MPLPLGFVPPCLPTKAPQPPSGEAWLQEIKHDGFRVIARKDGDRVHGTGPPRLWPRRASRWPSSASPRPCWSRTSPLLDVGNQLASCARTKCYADAMPTERLLINVTMETIITAAVVLAFSLTAASAAADRVPPLLWGQWLIGFDAESWSGNCKDGHGYEVLNIEPRRMYVNEFGCTITSATVITKRTAPIANAGLDLQVSLTCSGEGRRGNQNLKQLWSVFQVGKATFMAIADRSSVALLRKCEGP
jgi:hypothetical protein